MADLRVGMGGILPHSKSLMKGSQMFATLRNAIASMFATKKQAQCTMTLESSAKNLTYGKMPSFLANQPTTESFAFKGEFSTSNLNLLNSTRVKEAICGLGAWSALARAFNAYNQNLDKPIQRRDDEKVNALIDEFHAWNSCAQNQMDEDAVMDLATRLADVQPAKGNAQTDIIIARVRKCTVEEVRADRDRKAKVKAAIRVERIVGFVEHVWSWSVVDTEYSIPMAKVIGKVIQTMEWVAGWDAFDPAQVAAEILLMEDDLRTLEKLAKNKCNDHGEKFIDGVLTADGMMRQSA
jgi:hypothetical protein